MNYMYLEGTKQELHDENSNPNYSDLGAATGQTNGNQLCVTSMWLYLHITTSTVVGVWSMAMLLIGHCY